MLIISKAPYLEIFPELFGNDCIKQRIGAGVEWVEYHQNNLRYVESTFTANL